MSLVLRNVSKPASTDKVLVTRNSIPPPVDAYNGMPVYENDLLETQGSTSSVAVNDGSSVAAVVQGTNSSITMYSPPSSGLDRIYYNNSYRYKLRSPGGYVGIRG